MPLILRTALAMTAFAGNSLLCRLALLPGQLDAASFTLIRLVSGALLLAWLLRRRDASHGQALPRPSHNWPSALALWAYAAAFSFAYLGLTAATGALILFGSVQVTMTGVGLARGERVAPRQALGFVLAAAGLLYLLLPGVAAPSPVSAALMVLAGVAWGVYSLRGRGSADALGNTAGNFALAVVPAALLSAVCVFGFGVLTFDIGNIASQQALLAAVVSGALASGAGYAIWYTVLPRISATRAAGVQLCVPVLAALGGVLFLGESLGWRLVMAAAVVLGGVALITLAPRRS
jgi:drug/metabolite transporter (DMT)-like permease